MGDHEHGAAAVERVHRSGKQGQEAFAEKREQDERGYDEREQSAIDGDDVDAQVFSAPCRQKRDCGAKGARHGHDVHENSDLRLVDGERTHDAAAEPERPDAEGASPIILQDAAVHGRVLARDVFEHGLRQIDFPAADYDA